MMLIMTIKTMATRCAFTRTPPTRTTCALAWWAASAKRTHRARTFPTRSKSRYVCPSLPSSLRVVPCWHVYCLLTAGNDDQTESPALERVSHIQRRYGDFAALHAALRTEEAACVVPPLPPARAVEQVTGGSRLGHTFVQLRQGELTLFLRRVARHPTLRLCRAFMSFLSPHWRGDPAHSEWVWALAPTPASLEAQRKQLVRSRRDLEHLHRALQRERNELAAHLFSLPDFPDPFAPALDLPPPDDLSDGYGDMAGAVQLLAGLESGMAPALFTMAGGLRRMGQLLTHDAKGTDNLCHGLGEIIALLQAGEEAISRAGRLESKADALQRTLDDRGLKVFVQTRWDTLRGKPDSVVQLERAERRQEAERALATTRADIANALERLGSQEPEWLRVEQELELRELLQDWTRSKVACSEAAVTAWDEVLDVLEAPLGA